MYLCFCIFIFLHTCIYIESKKTYFTPENEPIIFFIFRKEMIMAILADLHTHSKHSGDSNADMEAMINAALSQGLNTLCFTEHNDFDYPVTEDCPAGMFDLNVDPYLYDVICLRDKYKEKINLLFGIELGLMPEIMRKNAILSKSYEYDFIIASSHICHGKDPYYPAFFEGRSDREAFEEYFVSILENIKKFKNFDVYGHLDYVVRYSPNKDSNYSFLDYIDCIDEILNLLIENEKGIEINTGGYSKGLKDLHPCLGIVKRYRELGGEIITIGSDAHTPENIGQHFSVAENMLNEAGFKYYSTFEKRVAQFHRF